MRQHTASQEWEAVFSIGDPLHPCPLRGRDTYHSLRSGTLRSPPNSTIKSLNTDSKPSSSDLPTSVHLHSICLANRAHSAAHTPWHRPPGQVCPGRKCRGVSLRGCVAMAPCDTPRGRGSLAACRREEASQLLAWIAKSRLKQSKNSLEIARFGNLTKPKGNFSGFSDSLLGVGLRLGSQYGERVDVLKPV